MAKTKRQRFLSDAVNDLCQKIADLGMDGDDDLGPLVKEVGELLQQCYSNKGGELYVGHNPTTTEVVVQFPKDITGFITFTPDQARNFAALITKHAEELIAEKRAADQN